VHAPGRCASLPGRGGSIRGTGRAFSRRTVGEVEIERPTSPQAARTARGDRLVLPPRAHRIAAEIAGDALDLSSEAHDGSSGGGGVREHRVEEETRQPDGGTGERELDLAPAPEEERSPTDRLSAGSSKRATGSESVQIVDRLGRQEFTADLVTREAVALENDDREAQLPERDRGARSRGASADDGHVEEFPGPRGSESRRDSSARAQQSEGACRPVLPPAQPGAARDRPPAPGKPARSYRRR
jgi:hypothetical protein